MTKEEFFLKFKKAYVTEYKNINLDTDCIQFFQRHLKEAAELKCVEYEYIISGYISYLKDNLSDAKDLFLKAIELDDKIAIAWQGLGNVFKQQKEYGKAIDAYNKAIQLDDKFGYPWNGLGNVFLEQKEYDKAIDAYNKAILLDDKLAYSWNGLGNVFLEQKEYHKAIAAYNKAILLDDKFAYPWDGLGDVFRLQKEYDKAIDAYNKAILLDDKLAYPWNGLGDVFRLQKEYDKAIAAYNKVILLDDKLTYPWNGLGNIFYDQKEYNKAIDAYNKVTLLDDKLAYPWNGLGNIFYDQKEYDKAIDAYNKAIQLDDRYKFPWNGLGNIFSDQKEYDKAINAYNKVIMLDDKSAIPWNGLGNVYYRQKDYLKAIEAFSISIKYDANYATPWNGLGNVYYDKKDYIKAIEAYNHFIKLDDNSAIPWNGLGNVYYNQKDYLKAIEAFNKSIELDANEAIPWNGLGNVYYNQKDYLKAIEAYKQSIKLDNKLADPYYNLGMLYKDINNYEESVFYFNKSYELFDKTIDKYWISLVEDHIKSIESLLKAKNKIKDEVIDDKSKPIMIVLKDTSLFEDDILSQQNSFKLFLAENKTIEENHKYLHVLRRWNSYTPIIADNYYISKGGGYFLQINGIGIVIDPGFNFIDNFKGVANSNGLKYLFNDIDYVLTSHAHNDHTSDFESILSLLYQYNEDRKGLSGPTNGNTVKDDIAKENKRKGSINITITDDDVEKEFLKSSRRKQIDLFVTDSVRQKYSGMFELYSHNNYRSHTIEKGSTKDIVDNAGKIICTLKVIGAKHNDVISDRHSVGFVFEFDNLVFVYTGDTGWSNTIEKEYLKIRKAIDTKKDIILLAHLGGFDVDEIKHKDEVNNYDYFYKNHLGRLGLAKLNEVLMPKICFISEFGEEFKYHRIKVADIFQNAFKNQVIFIPADIGLKYDFLNKKIEAITSIDVHKMECSKGFIAPDKVKCCMLRKDYSLHYFDKDGDFSESDLIQVINAEYEQS